MGLAKKFLSENYKRMSNEELMSIVSNDIKDLTSEAQEVLQEEINLRGLGNGISNIIELQIQEITPERMEEYSLIIRKMPCPVCGTAERKLNAAIIFNNHYEDFTIACPTCLKKQLENAQARNMATGFAGGVGGVIKAVNQMSAYVKMEKLADLDEPNEILKAFIRKRIGEIEVYRNDKEKLARLIQYPNAAFF